MNSECLLSYFWPFVFDLSRSVLALASGQTLALALARMLVSDLSQPVTVSAMVRVSSMLPELAEALVQALAVVSAMPTVAPARPSCSLLARSHQGRSMSIGWERAENGLRDSLLFELTFRMSETVAVWCRCRRCCRQMRSERLKLF